MHPRTPDSSAISASATTSWYHWAKSSARLTESACLKLGIDMASAVSGGRVELEPPSPVSGPRALAGVALHQRLPVAHLGIALEAARSAGLGPGEHLARPC